MTSKNRRKSAGNANVQQRGSTLSEDAARPTFVSRYIGIDSHLIERNGSTELVVGTAAERPAGRKLAEDIQKLCIQLDTDGYDVMSIFPLTSGRTADVSVEVEVGIPDRTYSEDADGNFRRDDHGTARNNNPHYSDTGVGYSVTDGVVVIAKLLRRGAPLD